MTDEETFHAFLSGLVPHLQEHVGAHVQGDLKQAMAMAQQLEAYRGGEGAKASGNKGSRKFKKQNKQGSVMQCREMHLEGHFWWSKVNRSKVRARDARAISKRIRNAEEGSSKANSTIVVAIMRCGTAKNGRISRRNFSPQETDCPVHFAHTGWPPGLCFWIGRN